MLYVIFLQLIFLLNMMFSKLIPVDQFCRNGLYSLIDVNCTEHTTPCFIHFHSWRTFGCFYFYIFTANVADIFIMASYISYWKFCIPNRTVDGRTSSYSDLLYLAKLLSNEDGPTLCQLCWEACFITSEK